MINNFINRILFISEIKDPSFEDFSSTQIMTNNIVNGLRENCNYLCFVAIVDDACDKENVMQYYSRIANKVYVIRSKMNLTLHKNKYYQLLKTIQTYIQSSKYSGEAKKITDTEEKFDKIISHSPSMESIFLAKQLRNKNASRYIEYWSDPYAISGIYPEQLSLKRRIQYFIEQKMLKESDEVVYGTKTLFEVQKALFPRVAQKMRYIDVAYCTENTKNKTEHSIRKYIYSGDYYSGIRDIRSLYNAFRQERNIYLQIIGNSDLKLQNTENISIQFRKPYKEVSVLEDESDVIVCILNHSCVQIPGKIFYRANTNQRILVVLDGKYKDRIREYLDGFTRFDFCENNIESIRSKIKEIEKMEEPKYGEEITRKLSPKQIAYDLIGYSE